MFVEIFNKFDYSSCIKRTTYGLFNPRRPTFSWIFPPTSKKADGWSLLAVCVDLNLYFKKWSTVSLCLCACVFFLSLFLLGSLLLLLPSPAVQPASCPLCVIPSIRKKYCGGFLVLIIRRHFKTVRIEAGSVWRLQWLRVSSCEGYISGLAQKGAGQPGGISAIVIINSINCG